MIEQTSGGTRMHCPACASIQVCSAIPATELGRSSHQRLYWGDDHPDIQWFRRARQCQTCSERFLTAEVDFRFVEELVRFREAVTTLGDAFEAFLADDEAPPPTREMWDVVYGAGNRDLPHRDQHGG